MAVSDDKQNRLSTLSQDVIAVPKKPAASARAPERPAERAQERTQTERAQQDVPRPPERKPIPATQDVFKVSSPTDFPDTRESPSAAAYTAPHTAPPPPPVRAPARQRVAPAAAAPAGLSPVSLATAVVAVLALLVAVYGVTRDAGGIAAVDAPGLEQMAQELKAANDRVAKLEMALSAAASDTQSLNSPGQANVLQISAGMRSLRNDVDGVSNELARLTSELGEVRTLAGAGNGQAKIAMSQVEQLASRLATLNAQVANAPRATGGAAAAAPANADTQAQLKALSARTEKMAADIRQLYRLVGGQ